MSIHNGIEQQIRRSAGRIDLLVVVRLADLHVKAGELAGCLGREVAQGRNAYGVVARVQDGGVVAQHAQALHLVHGIAGSAANQGASASLYVGLDRG